MTTDLLSSWNDGQAKASIVDFLERVTKEGGADYVPPYERVATFDNDGTLWCEKPMPIELGFILKRLAEMVESDESLREKQPWKAAAERDYAWLGGVIDKHYHGDDSDVKVLMGGIIAAFAGWTVEEYQGAAGPFVLQGPHPTLGRTFGQCGYLPMVELLRYLEANGFTNYIASGGNRDFMRGFAQEIYDLSPERIIGSSNELLYTDDDHGGSVAYQSSPDVFDDGPAKPVRIWSRVGRRPLVAGGNSNGDIPMLRYAGGKGRPALRLLVNHDDEEREFAYTSGAEKSLKLAAAHDWTVISVKDDWSRVFADL